MKILHFADAHIDNETSGKLDSVSGLPVRVMDYLKSLDTIVSTAIERKVEAVIFAGDAFKGRTPAPTYQREWEKRIMQLSKASIPTVLITGNHDVSPAHGRAHAMESIDTLEVPNVYVINKPCCLGPDDLGGLQVNIVALPWISRSGMMAYLSMNEADPRKIYDDLEATVTQLILEWLDEIGSSDLPGIFAAHATVAGAKLSTESSITFDREIVLPASLTKDKRWDYVALGHIHLAQDLNDGYHPPVVYSGALERNNMGEANDEKYFIIADVKKGKTKVEWCKLQTRPFVDKKVKIESSQDVTDQILDAIPDADHLEGSVFRLTVEYRKEWHNLIDTAVIQSKAEPALSFQLNLHPYSKARLRLAEQKGIESLEPLELLERFWDVRDEKEEDVEDLKPLAEEIINESV